MNAKLEHDVARMGFDGPFGDDEHLGDLTVTFPMCNQGCHLALPHGQPSKGLLSAYPNNTLSWHLFLPCFFAENAVQPTAHQTQTGA